MVIIEIRKWVWAGTLPIGQDKIRELGLE